MQDGIALADMKKASCVHALHMGIFTLKSRELPP